MWPCLQVVSFLSFLFGLCVHVCVRPYLWVCMYTCLKCAAAKSDRTEAHISLPRKKVQRHTHSHTYTRLVYALSQSLSSQLCIFRTLSVSNSVSTHTHIHKHTCSPRPAKRERWLVNKQWHSAHSVTRLGFDQHRCSCSPQQCFLSFCLPNVATHVPRNTHTHLCNLVFVDLHTLSFSHFLLTKSLSVSFPPSNSPTNTALS